MKISAHTKVSEVIKNSSKAIDALVGISGKFSKLKNPLLRKIMAPRVTLAQAAKIGGVRTEDMFSALAPLGFEIEDRPDDIVKKPEAQEAPSFFKNVKKEEVVFMDVRPLLAGGEDPLKDILLKLKNLKENKTLCIINTFEPIPLIHLLQKKGYESYVTYEGAEEVRTYLHKSSSQGLGEQETIAPAASVDFEDLLEKYKGNIKETDVRDLEMPLPMLTILDLLETLPQNHILYVHHKKTPVYLLPELEDKGFEYFIHELGEGNVKLIIRHRS